MTQTQKLPIAVGIDIGSTAVRCVVGIHEEDAPAPSIIGIGSSLTQGVRKGTVHDIEDTVSAITASVDEAERISGVNVSGATVNIGGNHVITATSRGIIAVGGNNREITSDDLDRAEEAATVMQLPPNREIIQIFARNYTVDGQDHIKNPVGMDGMRLEVDTCLVTAATPFLKNTTRSLNQAGLSVHQPIAAPLAAARTLASKQDKEVGCAVLDIGSHTTGVAIYEENELMHAAIVPVGSAHITGDIAVGIRTDMATAEHIKQEHVDADPGSSHARESFGVEEMSGELLTVSTPDVNAIAHARLEELFDLVNAELSKVKRDGMLPGGVILGGGGANLSGIDECAKQCLRLPAHMRIPQGFSGIIDKIQNAEYATVIGLMLEDMEADHGTPGGNIGSTLAETRNFIMDIVHRFRG